ncbi:MAG: ATP-binding protein [Halorientalis sp.]
MSGDRFVREAREDVRLLSDGLVALERDPDRETVDDLFRTAHNLKGNLSMEGHSGASDIAHALEDVLDAVRAGRLDADADVTDRALDATDTLGTMLDEIERTGGTETDPDPVVDSLRTVTADLPDAGDSGAAADSTGDDLDLEDVVTDESVEAALDAASEFDDLDALAEDMDEPEADLDDVQGGGSMDDLFVDDENTGEVDAEGFEAGDADDADDANRDETADSAPTGDATDDESGADLWGGAGGMPVESDEEAAADTATEAAETETADDVAEGDASGDGAADSGPETPEAAESADEPTTPDAAEAAGDIEPADSKTDDEPVDADASADQEAPVSDLFAEEDDADPFDGTPESDAESAETAGDATGDDDPVEEMFTGNAGDDPAAGDDDVGSLFGDDEEETTDAGGALSGEEDDDSLGSEIDFIWAKQEVEEDETSVEQLQSEIEEESFGEFDEDDDMSIQELIDMEADPEDLADADEESAAATAEAAGQSTGTDGTPADAEAAGDAAEPDLPGGDRDAPIDPAAPAGTDPVPNVDAEAEADGVEAAAEDRTSPGEADADDAPPAAEADSGAVEETARDIDAAEARSDGPVVDDDEGTAASAEGATAPADESGTADADDSSVIEALEEQAEDAGPETVEEVLDSEAESALDADLVGDDEDLDEEVEVTTDVAEADLAFESDTRLEEFEERFAGMFDTDEDQTGPAGTAQTIAESALPTHRFEPAAGEGSRSLSGGGDLQSLTVEGDRAEELLSLTERLSQEVRQLSRVVESGQAEDAVSSLDAVVRDLQRTVMGIRLMPLKTVTSRIPRVVRDVARETGTEAEAVVEGEDIQLDRGVIDRIGDPLVHLVRNAVDHGLEDPDEREAAGKPRTGTVAVRAERDGESVTIEVEDDGAGIDPEQVRSAAVAEGVVDEETAEHLSKREVLDLLFHPGLSTREDVTETSGRGVGMDVVKQTVTGLSGSVEVESDPGEGTVVRLRIPVSVAVAEVLFVEAGGTRFALPADSIEHVGPAAGARVTDGGLLETGAATDRTVELATALGQADAPTGSDTAVVHVDTGEERLELRCDAVLERRDVVVTPYDDLLADIPELSGATTGSDGELIHVLDTTKL